MYKIKFKKEVFEYLNFLFGLILNRERKIKEWFILILLLTSKFAL